MQNTLKLNVQAIHNVTYAYNQLYTHVIHNCEPDKNPILCKNDTKNVK